MYIKAFTVNPIMENCYVAHDDTGEGVIIDCGCSTESEWDEVKHYLEQESITVKHLLCTHLHFDHVWGNPFVERDLGLRPEASELDLPLYNNIEEMVKRTFGIRLPIPPMPPLAYSLADGDVVRFGHTEFQVIATPGHSCGSLCFYCEKDEVLFAGDTLFRESIGRTDLEGGSMPALMDSLKRLMKLPNATNVLCSHGPYTSIGHEDSCNMFIRDYK